MNLDRNWAIKGTPVHIQSHWESPKRILVCVMTAAIQERSKVQLRGSAIASHQHGDPQRVLCSL